MQNLQQTTFNFFLFIIIFSEKISLDKFHVNHQLGYSLKKKIKVKLFSTAVVTGALRVK